MVNQFNMKHVLLILAVLLSFKSNFSSSEPTVQVLDKEVNLKEANARLEAEIERSLQFLESELKRQRTILRDLYHKLALVLGYKIMIIK